MTEKQYQDRIAELEEAQRRLPGVSEAIEEDVRRRMALGLSLPHAIQAAESQAANDERVAREDAAARKVAAAKAKEESELAAANKRIADLEAQLKAKQS
jgi:hypothetical protein